MLSSLRLTVYVLPSQIVSQELATGAVKSLPIPGLLSETGTDDDQLACAICEEAPNFAGASV